MLSVTQVTGGQDGIWTQVCVKTQLSSLTLCCCWLPLLCHRIRVFFPLSTALVWVLVISILYHWRHFSWVSLSQPLSSTSIMVGPSDRLSSSVSHFLL